MSQDNTAPITVFADEIAQNALNRALKTTELEGLCRFETHQEPVIILRYAHHEALYNLPVRIGKILDQIAAFKSRMSQREAATLNIGEGSLNTQLGTFRHGKTSPPVQLTEKEVDILRYLHENRGRIVTREELLDAVWGYAENVETHTLETHIYRLRQKIEKDPAQPQILKKMENGGYCLEE